MEKFLFVIKGKIKYFFLLFAAILISFGVNSQTITIDGNPADWNTVTGLPTYTYVLDDWGSGTDNQFTQGSKDFMLGADQRWSVGQTSNKTDIANAAAVIIGTNLYFAGDRLSTNGDANIGFWFYLNGTAPAVNATTGAQDFEPEHVVGDILIIADFSNGGTVSTITVYKWVGTGGAFGGGTLDLVSDINASVAQNNVFTHPIPTGWSYITADYPTNAFYEGYVDLTRIGTFDQCYSSFLLETRNSASINAMLGDFVAGSFAAKPNAPIVASVSLCDPGGSVTLNATGVGTIKWYSNATLTTLVNTGPTFTTPVISVTKTYWLTVTNNLNCTSDVATVTVTVTPKLICSISNFQNVTFYNGNNGWITVTASGGTAPYTYLWNDAAAQTTATATNLVGGRSYVVTITDAKGCVTTCEQYIETPVKAPSCTIAKTDVTCFGGNNGTATVTPIDMTAPYSYQWLRNPGTINEVVIPGVNSTISGLTAEIYGVNVTDANNLSSFCSIEIMQPPLVPIILVCNSATEVSCQTQEAVNAAFALWKTNISSYTGGTLPVVTAYSVNGQIVNLANLIAPNACGGSITVVVNATDACGQVASCNAVFTVTADITAPVIAALPAASTINCPDAPVFAVATATDACGNAFTLTSADVTTPGLCAGAYSVTRTWTARDACGNSSQASQTINVVDITAPVLASQLTDLVFECMEDVIIPQPVFEDNCSENVEVMCEIVGGGKCDSYEFRAGETEICFWAVDECGNISAKTCITITVEPCILCTYTQGYYGNAGGKSSDGENTYTTVQMIEHSVANWGGTLTIGLPGHSVTISTGQASCVISRLPGGGGIGVLPAGNISICNYKLLTKQGRIDNKLLAQTITLGLNLGIGTPLGSLLLTSDWKISGSTYDVKIDQKVIDAIIGEKTVAGLFDLANRALGGQNVGVSLTAIASAVDMINNAFDGCKTFDGYIDNIIPYSLKSNIPSGLTIIDSGSLKVYPNPFSEKVTFEFVSGSDAHAVLEITNLLGQKIQTLVDRPVEKGVLNKIEYKPLNMISGILIYRLILDGNVQMGKIVYTQ